jgi:hypothetical protein
MGGMPVRLFNGSTGSRFEDPEHLALGFRLDEFKFLYTTFLVATRIPYLYAVRHYWDD